MTFNKGIYNLISQDPVDRYIQRLISGELIHSNLKDVDLSIPIFLTYPTGWFFHKKYLELRKVNLDRISAAIQDCSLQV